MAGRREQIQTWGEDFQDRLITALEAQWAEVVDSDDAAVIGQGDKKARAIGIFARTGRSLVIMVPEPKRAASEAAEDEADMHDDHPEDPAELRAAVESKIAGIAALIERKAAERRAAETADEPDDGATAPPAQRLSG